MDEVPGSIPGVDRFILDGNGVGHGVCLLIAYAFTSVLDVSGNVASCSGTIWRPFAAVVRTPVSSGRAPMILALSRFNALVRSLSQTVALGFAQQTIF